MILINYSMFFCASPKLSFDLLKKNYLLRVQIDLRNAIKCQNVLLRNFKCISIMVQCLIECPLVR